jgi:ABC-2 type transport system permease protein
VIFLHLPRLAHWTLSEVAFLYGASYTAFKAGDMFVGNIDKLPLFIRMGSFDQVLTRPLGTLGQVLTADIDIRHFGGMTQGMLVLIFALHRLHFAWTAPRLIVFALMLVSAFVIFCSIWIATNSIAFWTMDAREIANAATYGGNFMTQFPMNLYGVWMRRLFGYVIPLAFVNYYPSLYLLGKDDPTHAPVILRFLSPLVAAGCAVVAGTIWRIAVRHYRSTGS